MSVPMSPKNFKATIDKHNISFTWDKVIDDSIIGYKIYLNSIVVADIKNSIDLEMQNKLSGEIDGLPTVLSPKINLIEENSPLSSIFVTKTEITEKNKVVDNTLKFKGFTKFIGNFIKLNELFGRVLFSSDSKTGKVKIDYEDFISVATLNYRCDGKFNYNNGEQTGEAYIVAYNADGESVASTPIVVKTSPNKPINLIGSLTNNLFKLRWENNSTVSEGYKVQVLNDGNAWETVKEIEGTATTEYVELNPLNVGRVYKYRVCATNTSGDGEYSQYQYYIPLTPSWKYTNEKLTFGLSDEVDAIGYVLKYKINTGEEQVVELTSTTKDYIYEIETARDAVVEFSILAKFATNDSFFSTKDSITPSDYRPINIPNFIGQWADVGLVRLTWNGNPRVKKYLMIYTINGEPQPIKEVLYDKTNSKDTYNYDIQLINNFDTLNVKVRAVNFFEEVESQNIEMMYVVVDEILPPKDFRRSRTDTGVRLDWSSQEFVTKYVVHYRANNKTTLIETTNNHCEIDIDYTKITNVSLAIESHFINGAVSDKTTTMEYSTSIGFSEVNTTIYTKALVEAFLSGIYKSSGLTKNILVDTTSIDTKTTSSHFLDTLSYRVVKTSFLVQMLVPSKVETKSDLDVVVISPKCTVEILLHQTNSSSTIYSAPEIFTTIKTKVNIGYLIDVEIHKTRIVTMGDSITAGHPKYWAESGTGDPQSQYQYWLGRRLGDSFEVLNKGYGRDTTTDLLNRFASTVVPINAKYCIIQIGTNDIYQAIVAGKDDQAVLDASMKVARENTISMINICLANNIIPIVGNLIPRTGAKGIYRTALWEHNNWIKEYAGVSEKIHYVNFYDAGKSNIPPTPLEDPNELGAMNPLYDGDTQYDEFGNAIVRGNGIHPSVEGYKLMGEAVPLTIFKSSTQGIKIFVNEACTIEENFETSSEKGKVYKLDIKNILRGKTKTTTRYIKNIGIEDVIYAVYPVKLNDMSANFSVNEGEFSNLANGFLVAKGVQRVDIAIEISKTSQSPELYLGVAGRVTKTTTSQERK
ncbi:MAG: GDSL-type esterase/lipase family protein [Clostridium sp.]